MQVFKSKVKLANYLNLSRPAIETKIKRKEVKQIQIGKVKGYVIVLDFIKYLLE